LPRIGGRQRIGSLACLLTGRQRPTGAQVGGQLKQKIMVGICIYRAGFAFAFILLIGKAPEARAQEGVSVQQSITDAQVALRHRHYSQAARTLEDSLKRFPGNAQLRLELGRVYVYRRQDARAMEIFRAILRDDPSYREAKLELARVLSYDGKYEAANQFFRELLAINPSDEAAGIGLVRNLLLQKKKDQARREVEQALTRHPNSISLQKYRDDLQKNQLLLPVSREISAPNRVQAETSYFSDSAGNRVLSAGQRLEVRIGRQLTNSFRLDEKSLWVSQGPKASIFTVNDEGRVRLARWLFVAGGAGIVRFADDSNRALYRGTLILHPFQSLWLQGGFSRIPITPTFQSTQFDLLAEGWWSRLDWQPRSWRITADFFKRHYSDSNRTQREDAAVLRWIGASHFAVGLGYQYTHSSFTQTFSHGYFNPNQYHSHLGLGRFRFVVGKIYRGEYVGQYGAESVLDTPYQIAWAATAKNRLILGRWDLDADYTYFHLAQTTGAFRAQVVRFRLGYHF